MVVALAFLSVVRVALDVEWYGTSRHFKIQKVFVSSLDPKRFLYLSSSHPKDFRIFWIRKVFVSFGSRRFSYLFSKYGGKDVAGNYSTCQ